MWMTSLGSGMGLPHSSDVSDLALLNLAEKDMMPGLASMGIEFMARCRDDVLVIASSREAFRNFFLDYRKRSGFFDLKVDDYTSGPAIRFLDCNIVRRGRSYTSSYYLKETLGRPLGEDSLHHPSIHRWPIVMLRAILRRTPRVGDAVAVKRALIRRFVRCHASTGLVDALARVGSILDANHKFSSASSPVRQDVKACWVVLPFHPVWFEFVSKSIREFSEDPAMASLLRCVPSFRERSISISVSWRNLLPPHGESLTRKVLPSE